MKELLRTKYGATWFRSEGANLDAVGRRTLLSHIRDWERVAIDGVTGWAHAQGAAASAARYPHEDHMREMIIEVRGIEYIQKIEADHLKKKQKRELEVREREVSNDAYLEKLDSQIDDWFD
jgi:hypothetical protein